jgi:hypothetical protein
VSRERASLVATILWLGAFLLIVGGVVTALALPRPHVCVHRRVPGVMDPTEPCPRGRIPLRIAIAGIGLASGTMLLLYGWRLDRTRGFGALSEG